MLPRKPRLIAFDLDGTLLDSAPDIAYALDATLLQLGRSAVGEDQIRLWIGHGASMLVSRGLTGEMWPNSEPQCLAAAVKIFMAVYESNLCVRGRLYPGVESTLNTLKDEGFLMACITNKPSKLTRPLLKLLNLERFFEFVGAGDDFQRPKPDPEPLFSVANHFNVQPSDCLMVGDSSADAQAAHAAGFMLACVAYGYHGENPVDVLGADVILDSFGQLDALSLACS